MLKVTHTSTSLSETSHEGHIERSRNMDEAILVMDFKQILSSGG